MDRYHRSFAVFGLVAVKRRKPALDQSLGVLGSGDLYRISSLVAPLDALI
jgi:hypothetical protein